jgi:hypothetical protein
MADEYIITNLSSSLGFILEDLVGFIAGFFTGWVLMLSILTIGVIISLYWRFFRNTTDSVAV